MVSCRRFMLNRVPPKACYLNLFPSKRISLGRVILNLCYLRRLEEVLWWRCPFGFSFFLPLVGLTPLFGTSSPVSTMARIRPPARGWRSEEHTSDLQSRGNRV